MRGLASTPAAALALALAGCASDRVLVTPELGDARALILASESPAQTLVLWPGEAFEAAEAASYVLLVYRAEASALGLAHGPIEGPGACLPCALAAPDASYQASGAVEGWTALDAPPAWLLDRLLPDRSPRCERCPSLARLALSSPVAGARVHEQLTALPLDARTAIVTQQESGAFFRVASDGAVEAACVPEPSELRPRAAYRAGGTRAWYADQLGRLRELDLAALRADRPCTAATTTLTPARAGAPLVRVHGSPSGDELLALDADARAARYAGRAWAELGVLPEPDGEWGVLWRGPGRALFGAGSDRLLRVEPTRSELLLLDAERVPARPTAIAEIEGLGAVLGTSDRLLLFETAEHDWALPPITVPTSQRVEALTAYRGGVALSIRDGGLRLYSSANAYCASQPVLGGPGYEDLVALEGDVLLAAGPELLLLAPDGPTCPR